jgi:hypothetical protein
VIVELPNMDSTRGRYGRKRAAYSRSTLKNIRASLFSAAAHGEIVQVYGCINDQIHTVVGQARAAGCAIGDLKTTVVTISLDEDDRKDGEDI